MRSVQVRGIRRDLRRAFGADALRTIDNQGASLESIANSLTLAHRRLDALEARLDILDTWFGQRFWRRLFYTGKNW